MKYFSILLLMGMLAFGQSGIFSNIDGLLKPLPDKDLAVLLIWQTTEKCYECHERTAMMCSGQGSDDCNVPSKTVTYYGFFKSAEEALHVAEVQQLDVKALLGTSVLPFDKTEEAKHEKQPDKVTPVLHYKAKDKP